MLCTAFNSHSTTLILHTENKHIILHYFPFIFIVTWKESSSIHHASESRTSRVESMTRRRESILDKAWLRAENVLLHRRIESAQYAVFENFGLQFIDSEPGYILARKTLKDASRHLLLFAPLRFSSASGLNQQHGVLYRDTKPNRQRAHLPRRKILCLFPPKSIPHPPHAPLRHLQPRRGQPSRLLAFTRQPISLPTSRRAPRKNDATTLPRNPTTLHQPQLPLHRGQFERRAEYASGICAIRTLRGRRGSQGLG